VGTVQFATSRSAVVLLSGAVIALVVVVAVSLQHETSLPRSGPADVRREPTVAAPPPLTAAEEAFAAALWPWHQEIVEPSAGRLSSAGLAFAIDDHDAHRLTAKLTPLRQVFHDTRIKVAALSVPPSLQAAHDRYVDLLGLYEQSATEMLEVARDGDEGHLIDAQIKSEHAAEELVRVGDILWPGEHKPN
jgi:hypothetical protein